MSNSLRPHEPWHTRPPFASPTPRIHPNPCALSRWCHPTISSSVPRFSSYPQSCPASESFPVSQLFASCHQSTGASASASVLPMNYSGLISFRIDWFDLLVVHGTLKNLLHHPNSKALIFQCSDFFMIHFSHLCMTTGKTMALTRWTFVGKVMSLFFHMLSRLVIVFLPRSKCLLISWQQSPSSIIIIKSQLAGIAWKYSLPNMR